MGYINFLLWAQKVSRNKILQKYLNKAWQEGTKGGKEILQSQWPKLLKKAQSFSKSVPDKVSKITTKYFFLSKKFTSDTPNNPNPPVTKNFFFNFYRVKIIFL